MGQNQTMNKTTRQNLENSKPIREDFLTAEEFEEAHGYWMGHQGKVLALHRQSQEPSEEDLAIHDQVMAFLQTLRTSPDTTDHQN